MSYEDNAGGEVYHSIRLRRKFAGRETVRSFGILNLVAGSVQDRSLESWAASEKLFPWVAVAAPLEVCSLTAQMEDKISLIIRFLTVAEWGVFSLPYLSPA